MPVGVLAAGGVVGALGALGGVAGAAAPLDGGEVGVTIASMYTDPDCPPPATTSAIACALPKSRTPSTIALGDWKPLCAKLANGNSCCFQPVKSTLNVVSQRSLFPS